MEDFGHWRPDPERLLVTGVEGIVGANLALSLSRRFEVVGLFAGRPVSLPGCTTARWQPHDPTESSAFPAPAAAGVDPSLWTAGLRQLGPARSMPRRRTRSPHLCPVGQNLCRAGEPADGDLQRCGVRRTAAVPRRKSPHRQPATVRPGREPSGAGVGGNRRDGRADPRLRLEPGRRARRGSPNGCGSR